jgi:SAM-dependent methyltransferase
MIREAHYHRKLPHRGRGVADLERRVGGILADIDARLGRRESVRVLELGCGYGTALLDLRARYGRRVELYGLNRLSGDGNAEILLRNATDRGLAADESPLPTIVHADAAAGLPFADDSFDVVYSQVAWLYFASKVGVIRDVIRVLDAEGVARIDADEVRPGLPPEYARLVEIWEDGQLLPFRDYLGRHGMSLAPAPDGEYLRFGKATTFGEDLSPVFEIDLARLHVHWDGIKCVYVRAARK